MSSISQLNQVRVTLKMCTRIIAELIRKWHSGEIDTSSDSDDSHIEQQITEPINVDTEVDDVGDVEQEEVPRLPGIYKKVDCGERISI